MHITDPIADMLTRIRNANSARHDTVDVPASNMKKSIAQILLDEGYIKSYQIVDDGTQGVIHITLKYNGKDKVINLIKQYKLQLNLLSLAGYHGSGAKKYAEQMLRQGLYTFVGTDTHSNAYLDALQRARISKKVFDAVNVLKENNRTLF